MFFPMKCKSIKVHWATTSLATGNSQRGRKCSTEVVVVTVVVVAVVVVVLLP